MDIGLDSDGAVLEGVACFKLFLGDFVRNGYRIKEGLKLRAAGCRGNCGVVPVKAGKAVNSCPISTDSADGDILGKGIVYISVNINLDRKSTRLNSSH